MLNFRKLLLLSLTLTILSGLMIGCNDDDNDGDPAPTSLEAAFS